MKRLYTIAGPNGAGKTTASLTILPDVLDCREFVNADEIAGGLSPFQPETVNFAAGRLMLERAYGLIAEGEDPVLETTRWQVHSVSSQDRITVLFLMVGLPKTGHRSRCAKSEE